MAFLLILTIGSLYEWKRKKTTHRPYASFGSMSPEAKSVPACFNENTKKMNSAFHKIAKVRLSNRHDIFAHFPGKGHNLEEHFTVLIRGGRVKDLPGVKFHCIQGVKDLLRIPDRRRGKSKYGVEKPKSI
ncbi:hypothetical protein M9H77_32206 [Catharanthus roseus]|uniref:Uncharacterized protein n=1 Tax=Catharanthus roseus TaxID=4058 RepID=A0ACC0A4A7_CATRO|nr:hypothetical protein M9H77_32206 [Catharanthus roseus]